MKRTMKKTLFALLVCIILLAGAAFVSSGTAVNTEPVVADLSEKTGTQQYAFNPEANNRINYVVTGSNPDAEIYVWGSCNITLRNASFRRLHIDYEDSYTVNITLEGENTINQYNWASQGALEIYSSQVTINGGENDSLYASSRAFTVYSNSDALGCLTVNGGNCTFEAFDTSTPFQTTYIQNGGNVKVIGTSYCFLYNLTLNAGSLDILGKSSSSPPFRDEVYIKKGASFKVSLTSNTLNGWGQFNLAESSGANDCMFVRFDDSSEFIYLSDGNSEINGKNYMEIKVIEHIHACENGVCPCGFVCEHNTDGGTCGICGKYIYKIAHQPTAAEPYVSLNDSTGASYQWYEVSGLKEITDDDGVISVQSLWEDFAGEGEVSYSEADGWTGAVEAYEYGSGTEYWAYYFAKSFNAGDTVVVNISSPAYFAFYGMNTDWYYEVYDKTVDYVSFTVEETGIYCIATWSLNEPPTVKVYSGNIQESAMAGQTGATLTKLSYGKCYYCSVTAADGTIHRSGLLNNSYKITHQPTDMQQYVELNDSTGASYQWYIEKEGIVPVTDENDVSFEILGAPPEIGGVYDSVNGWIPDEDGYYFTAEMKAGDVLTLEFSQTPEEICYLYSSVEGTVENDVDITGAASFTAPSDGYYGIWASNGGTLKATFYGIGYLAEEGQTEAVLNADKLGKYLCEVTFADGTKEKSDIVEVLHLHSGGTASCKDTARCSVCGIGYGKLSTVHTYDNACDGECNVCKVKRTPAAHKYDNACDKECNVCKATRKISHTYDNECDTECNVCKAKRSVSHSYKESTTKATTSKNGKTESRCTACGELKSTETVYYPKTVKFSKTEYTYNGKAKKPTVTVKDSKGNTLKQDRDYTVKYESGRKSAGKYTVTITFKGKYSGTKKLNFTIAPKKTSKISASQTTTAITLKWNKVTGADGYRVYKYNSKTKKYEKYKDVTKTTLKISKLKAGTAYKYKVRAYTKDDGTILGDYSAVFETATKCKAPKITKLTSTTGKATVKWSNVSGESGYQIYYSTKKDSGFKKVKSYKANTTKGSKSKLKSGKKYYFKVRAYKKTDSGTVYSAWSAVKSVKIK